MRLILSRSAIPSSIAARSATSSRAAPTASSSLARARAMGVRRSCAMASETPRTPTISVPIWSSMAFIVCASRSNSSSRPESATRDPRSPPPIAAAVRKAGRSRACSTDRSSQAPSSAKRMTAPEAQITPSVSNRRSISRSVSSRPTSRRSPGRSTRCSRASTSKPSWWTTVRNHALSAASGGQRSILPASRRLPEASISK